MSWPHGRIKFVELAEQEVKQRKIVMVGRQILSQMTSRFGDLRSTRRTAGGIVSEGCNSKCCKN